MPEIQINLIAILIATVVGFFLSFAWYTPLFGKMWAKEMGFDPNETPKTPDLIKSLALTVFSVFLISFVLAHNIAAWTPATWGSSTAALPKAAQAFQSAFFTWVGFFLSNLLLGVAWEKRSWKLFAIDAGYYFSLLLSCAFILIYLR
jgi:hypothetical protein